MERQETRKVTVELPAQLLEDARSDDDGVTETIRKALETRARQLAGQRLLRWVGKINFTIPLEELREDREDLD